MQLTILSPEQEIFSGAVKSVTVPGVSGGFEMLENHAPIVSALSKGEIRVVNSNGERLSWQISGGFVEMLNNDISVLISGVS